MPQPLKRKIGYVKPKVAAKKIVETPTFKAVGNESAKLNRGEPIGPEWLADSPMCKKPATAKQLIAWIQKHPLFKWGTMCQQIGIDKANFKRTMESEEQVIKPEIASKIEAILRLYGFGK